MRGRGTIVIDPFKIKEQVISEVCKDNQRRYYRLVRGGAWYGGIATADCCGCILKCVFCYSDKPRDFPGEVGRFYSPEQIFHALIGYAKKRRYHQLRISGNEPTLCKEHLLKILHLVDTTSFSFILETNGLLIDEEYARDLARFKNLHVRVSLKGTNPDEFSKLTLAEPHYFSYQIDSLKNLSNAGISCHPAVMLSISPRENFLQLLQTIHDINPSLASDVEKEYIILYPHVIKRLEEHNIKPLLAIDQDGIPRKFT